MSLREVLDRYLAKDPVSFHMPGHKHGRDLFRGIDLIRYDWTEVGDLDNLHDARGVIADLEGRLRNLWGSRATKLSVGGSTACNLAAILGTASRGSKILVDRNAHRSVYHAIVMGELRAEYCYPLTMSPAEWEITLRRHADAAAVIWTYPTYEGLCFSLSDQIALCRSILPEAVLIVDEAHGAHLGFDDRFPKDALRSGADVVIQSLHKTLPALTMTSVLHYSNDFWDANPARYEAVRERIDWYLAAIQSSSPSYLLMASIEEMAELLETQGKERVERWIGELRFLRTELERRGRLIPIDPAYAFDPSKILMRCNPGEVERLARDYAIRFELSTDDFALLMVSMSNNRSDSDRLLTALDAMGGVAPKEPVLFPRLLRTRAPHRLFQPWEVIGKPKKQVKLRDAIGHVAGSNVVPYPPGVPVVVAGEVFGEEEVAFLERCGISVCDIMSMR